MMTKNLQQFTEIAIMSALAIVFNYIILFQLPQGGSLSLTFVPIILISLRRGILSGSITGLITGLFTLFFGGYFLNPVQVLFDYLLAYALMGVAGLFANQLKKAITQHKKKTIFITVIASSLISGLFSLINHFLAGIFFYQSFAPEGQPVWLYSLIYNASYVVPNTLIAIIVILILANRIPNFFTKS